MTAEILHFIMELARWMDLGVVAEGVETRQLERLKKADCDYAQGIICPTNAHKRIRGTAQKRANSHGAGGMGDEDAREPQPLPVLLVADETPLTART